MTKRIGVAVLLASAVAGCKAGMSFHGQFEVGQWTPELSCWARKDAGDNFDLVGHGGVANEEASWSVDASLEVRAASRSGIRPYNLNFGYWQHTYKGTGPGGVTFAGVPLGAGTRTVADLSLYKFTYEEPNRTEGGDGRTGGLIGLHYLDFAIKADDGVGPPATFDDSAPMFVLGWKIVYYSKGLMYYFSYEGMDLDIAPIDNVGGDVSEAQAGIRWFINDNAAISFVYRNYKADLNIGSDRFDLELDGMAWTFFMRW